jgi:hypothetical protein
LLSDVRHSATEARSGPNSHYLNRNSVVREAIEDRLEVACPGSLGGEEEALWVCTRCTPAELAFDYVSPEGDLTDRSMADRRLRDVVVKVQVARC